MYNQAKINIGIDTLVFLVNGNIVTDSNIDKLKTIFSNNGIKFNHQLNNHQYVIYNQYESSICSIDNYIKKEDTTPQTISRINLFGMNQVFTNGTLQKEHKLILKWLVSIQSIDGYNILMQDIDVSLDHYYGYDNTIVKYGSSSDLINQNDYEICRLSKFGTKEVMIPKEYTELLSEIESKINLSESVSYKDSYIQKVILNCGNQYNSFKSIVESTVDELKMMNIIEKLSIDMYTHIKFNVKDSNTYYQIKSIIKKHSIDVTQRKKEITYHNIFSSVKNPPTTKVTHYNKQFKDKQNPKKEHHSINHYIYQAKEHHVKLSQIKHDRIEASFKKIDLNISDCTAFTTLMSKIKEQIDKLDIMIFSSKKERQRYQFELKNYNQLLFNNKQYNKLTNVKKRRTSKVNLKDFNVRILKVDDSQIIKMVDNLELLLVMGV